MPMIDVYASKRTFANKPDLIKDLTETLMRWEEVPPITWFRENTAAFIHEFDGDSLGNANGETNYVRVQVLTPIGILDRNKKLGITRDMTDIIVAAAGDPSLRDRIWVQIIEAPDGGWGIDGHAYTNAEIAAEAKRQLAAG